MVAIGADATTREIANEKGRWIDALAMRGGAFAWSAGKQVSARDEAGSVRTWTAPSSVRGLAFQPKGYRLAATHYNGVSLWFPKVEGPPQTLEWKGAHLDATFSPDGRFLVTSMQENALHGWRLAEFAQHADDRLSRARRGRCRGRTTAPGLRPRGRTRRSSGRSRTRTGRWARRRANAACAKRG